MPGPLLDCHSREPSFYLFISFRPFLLQISCPLAPVAAYELVIPSLTTLVCSTRSGYLESSYFQIICRTFITWILSAAVSPFVPTSIWKYELMFSSQTSHSVSGTTVFLEFKTLEWFLMLYIQPLNKPCQFFLSIPGFQCLSFSLLFVFKFSLHSFDYVVPLLVP